MQIIQAVSESEMDQVFKVRKIVFVEEQRVPLDREIDAFEKESTHFLGREGHQPIGASRLRITGNQGKLERICILSDYRGQSLGKQMIYHMEQSLKDQNITKAKLNAQTHAISFYERLGYEVVSDEFIDAGIPHQTMIKKL